MRHGRGKAVRGDVCKLSRKGAVFICKGCERGLEVFEAAGDVVGVDAVFVWGGFALVAAAFDGVGEFSGGGFCFECFVVHGAKSCCVHGRFSLSVLGGACGWCGVVASVGRWWLGVEVEEVFQYGLDGEVGACGGGLSGCLEFCDVGFVYGELVFG